MKSKIPDKIAVYFWGDNLQELDWVTHKNYIVQTLLEKGNFEALQWLFAQIQRADVQQLLPHLKLQPKSSNFWRVYLS